ncbi:hypothetical protein OQX63_06640 [Pedobacter sp. PF22-3]|uniref:hypothetical protein n=1 Tax=Pedobacter sp. PF22-3 TaxID=2994467 RepID=UPI002245109D|nr:hypothetical protein [Pedobacter sp. PF22-3]MCX2493143.1 hypothetical protein [Pedobacter sp. PF22-3]
MEEIPEPQMSYVGKKIAYYSAIIGTLIFLTYLISNSFFLIIAGAVFTLSAAIVNIIVIALIIVELISYQNHWRRALITIISMLLNIPLVLLYIFALSYFHL